MAKNTVTVVTYTSDLSGVELKQEEVVTLKFSWEGTPYQIDLTQQEADEFSEAMAKYTNAASELFRSASAQSAGVPSRSAKIREFFDPEKNPENAAKLKEKGLELKPKGAVATLVEDLYFELGGED